MEKRGIGSEKNGRGEKVETGQWAEVHLTCPWKRSRKGEEVGTRPGRVAEEHRRGPSSYKKESIATGKGERDERWEELERHRRKRGEEGKYQRGGRKNHSRKGGSPTAQLPQDDKMKKKEAEGNQTARLQAKGGRSKKGGQKGKTRSETGGIATEVIGGGKAC